MMGDLDFYAALINQIKKEMSDMKPVNIMVVGKTGVGKSTLINQVFRERLAETGVGRPVTKHLRKISKEGIPINLYDTRGLELDAAVQEQIKKEIVSEINRVNGSLFRQSNDEAIHVCWYCVNANSNRIEDYEIDLMKEIGKNLSVILVLTQSFRKKNGLEFKKVLENENLNISAVVIVLAEAYEIDEEITIPSYGLKELVEVTYQVLPEGIKRSFNNAQRVDIDKKVRAAKEWAMSYITGTGVIGATPIPFADAPLLASAQVAMLAHITTIFGVSVDKALLTAIISSIGGVSGATIAGRTLVANLLKFAPGAGSIVGGAISASVAMLITTAMALAYIEVMKFILEKEQEGKSVSALEIGEKMKEEYKSKMTYLKRKK